MEKWEAEKLNVDKKNQENDRRFNGDVENWNTAVNEWGKRKDAFYLEREEYNAKVDDMEKNYLDKNPDSINEYCDMVLNNSCYPENFPKNYELEYIPATKMLVIEYELPSQDNMPILKEVKYVASRNELKETYIAETQRTKMYDDAIYKITLRSIHEIFEADVANAIDAVSFNGWVNAINKATGKEENNCILSIQVKKDEFVAIDLRNVDPKTCFKSLKGIASSKLSSLTPIQPVLQISKTDKRFVESYDVVQSIDNATNLAAMDWEDFEHMIRELFEKEFAVNGGEVKVTQASRDGGVDAVAFDPDPIRGGKIVIQAKRYTNTVGVSAVRDLYGTTMNEGATKGILVTTADFGPDAYDFAKGKPLTLLNGSNLLHLLEKHGHHARIDLKEAKKMLSN
jgi:restriction system protein